MSELSLSTTAVSTAMQCMAKYNYRYKEHLVSQPRHTGVALRRGIWIHACLEAIHRGRGYGRLLTDLADWAADHGVEQEHIDEVQTQVTHIIDGYQKYWAEHERRKWTPVAAEEKLCLPLPNGDALTCTIDTIVEVEGKGLYIVEHKSTQQFPDADWRAIDPQTALQYAICRATRKYDVQGVIFNYLCTREPPVPQVKKDGSGFYATSITTTSWAFEKGAEHLAAAGHFRTESEFVDYLGPKRAEMVFDEKFYARHTIYKPDALVMQILREVKAHMEMIRACESSGVWPHSINMLRCGFCPYSKVCPVELIKGGVAQGLRDEYLAIETTDLYREGRVSYE